MTDIARLQIRIESLEAQVAQRRLDSLGKSAGGAERASSGLMGAFKGLLGPLTAVVSATAALNKLVDVQRQFDVLNAGLVTATGSAEGASQAFEALQDFAANTPYDLAQVTDGFTKLVNLGLTPSERALQSYGNTASAMGKDMMQLIEAVADASTGEFERLKEFGIKAKQEGDKVTFTFRGVKTEIGNNAQEIEEYLMRLGENEFAGSMAARMDTLDGALSNLGDEWDALFRNVSSMGVGSVIEDGVRLAIDVLAELNAMLSSGEMEGYLDAIAGKFSGFGEDIQQTVQILTKFIKDNFGEWSDEGSAVVDFIIDAFKNFPENVRAFVQIAAVEFAHQLELMKSDATLWADSVKAIFNDDTLDSAAQRHAARYQALAEARLSSISDIMAERDAALKSFDDQMAASKKLREQYDKDQEARRAQGGDRLAGFKVGGDGGSSASSGASKEQERAAKQREKDFQNLVASLRTEEEAIAESYAKRRAIIEANTPDGSAQRADLLARLDQDHSAQLAKLQEQQNSEVESLRSQLMTEEEAIAESYQKRMEIIAQAKNLESAQRTEMEARVAEERDKALANIEAQRQQERDSLYNSLLTEEEMLIQAYDRKKQLILDSEAVTEVERQDLLRRLKQQFDEEQAQAESKRLQTQLNGAAQLFDGMAGLAKAYGGEQSKAYKALFAVSKAFSIAQAAMSISTGLAKAQELGWPANLAEMARVAATGAGIVSQIQGSNFSGAYDQGGQIPAGKFGIVGEYGPEIVRGPASVTGRVATERMMRETSGESAQASPPVVNVRNINVMDPSVVGDYLGTDDGEQMIMNVVQRNQAVLGR